MKKVYSLAIVLLLVVCAFFTSCGSKGLVDNPNTDATVYGNGGIAVIKEDYLYFVNGYDDSSKFTSYRVNNVEGKVERGAIYRTKLDSNGNVQRDENGFLINCERVVSKTVGFDNGGFYIIGDYIYFLTPHMENDETGTLQSSWLDIRKIKIDGSGKSKRLYYTQSKPSNFEWSAILVDNTPYLIINDEGKLLSINANSGKKIILAESTTSIAMPKFETFEYENVDNFNKYVYYTRNKTEDDEVSSEFTGNVVCKVNITNKSDKVEFIDNQNNNDVYNVVKYENGHIFYTKSDSRYSEIGQIYKRNVKEVEFKNAVEVKLTLTSYSDYIILSDGNSEKTLIVTVDSNNVVRLVSQNGQVDVYPTQTILFNGNDKEVKLIAVEEEIVYYTIDSKVCTLNLYDENQEQKSILSSDKTYKIDVENLISVINNKVFVLAQYKPANASDSESANYYLNVITTTIDETDSSQFLGKFAKNETPANPNDDLEDDEEPVLPWVK